MDSAKMALERAYNAEAPKYASQEYTIAENTLQEAQMEMANQKGRIFPFKSYKYCDSLIVLSKDQAILAFNQAVANKSKTRQSVQEQYDSFSREITGWRAALDGSLFLLTAEKHWDRANLALKISRKLLKQELYQEALEQLESGKDAIRNLSQSMENYVNSQAEKAKTWEKWINQTIEASKRDKDTAIIVVKATHKLYLIKSGSIAKTFKCDLGYNSAHQKFFSGDGATPEGTYKVTKINNGSKYYRAMMLDYPNENDKHRFSENKAKGVISRYARIGALIEIHGHGGLNRDWTEGCVALTNEDIDKLMKHVRVGTPVTIVQRSEDWP